MDIVFKRPTFLVSWLHFLRNRMFLCCGLESSLFLPIMRSSLVMTLFYRPSVWTEPADFHWHRQRGKMTLCLTDKFQLVSWLSTSLSAFYIITHNLITELISFSFFPCTDFLGCYQHLVNGTFRNMFRGKRWCVPYLFTRCIILLYTGFIFWIEFKSK